MEDEEDDEIEEEEEQPPSVLFLSFGNKYRSPICAYIFRHLLHKKYIDSEWIVDSAALSTVHVGEEINEAVLECLKMHSVPVPYPHKVRFVTPDDFRRFKFIFCMDELDMSLIKYVMPDDVDKKIKLFGTYHPDCIGEIKDPFYEMWDISPEHEEEVLNQVYDDCLACCRRFLYSQVSLLAAYSDDDSEYESASEKSSDENEEDEDRVEKEVREATGDEYESFSNSDDEECAFPKPGTSTISDDSSSSSQFYREFCKSFV